MPNLLWRGALRPHQAIEQAPNFRHSESDDRDEVQGQDNAAAEDHEPPPTGRPADHDKDASASTGNGDRPGELPSSNRGAVIARMKTYARDCAAQGRSITGADLDRQFGTRDYGRKVLRQLAAETTRSP